MVCLKAQPVITLPNGTELVKTTHVGKSTFFPDNWDKQKNLDEVEYAIENNKGRDLNGSPNEYYGQSRDGKVEIHFCISQKDGSIISFFPKKK